MMLRSSIGLVAGLVILACSPARAANPLDDLIEPVNGKSACFIRLYDAAHLRAHPRQKTTAMTVWMKYEPIVGGVPGIALGVSLAIMQRGDPAALFSQGGCEWNEKANRDTSNNRLIKTFPKEAGAVCLQSARPDVFDATSAQEGGSLILDRGRDRDTLMVYLDDSLTMVKRANRGKLLDIKFDADDRVFLLRRTGMKDCAVVEEAVTEPEPGVRRR
jgi:hypothetical protein